MPLATNFLSGNVKLQDALKIIQKSGTKELWREKNAFDAVFKKKAWEGGRQVEFHLSTSAGGGSMGGLATENSYFPVKDKAKGIRGSYGQKFTALTLSHDILQEEASRSEKAAYVSEKKREYDAKMKLARTELAVQTLGDGTGRKATPVGFGELAVNSGANFTMTEGHTLAIKIGNNLNVVGSIAHLYEDAVVSFVYADYSLAEEDGSDDSGVDTTCIPRLLTVNFNNGTNNVTYDAFRVTEYDQYNCIVYLVPGRKHTSGTAVVQDFVQQNYWVADNSNTLTCTLRKGYSFDYNEDSETAPIADIDHIFNPPGDHPFSLALVHPGFLPTGDTSFGSSDLVFSSYDTTEKTINEIGRLTLGIGWDNTTKVDKISPFVCTGFDALLRNRQQVIHGIPRPLVRTMLPTRMDAGGRTLDLSMINSWIRQHIARNEGKLPEWNAIMMNTLVYGHFETLFMKEMKVETGPGIGGFASHYIIVEGKKFQFTSHPSVRHDVLFSIPDKLIEKVGFELKQVSVGGTDTWIGLDAQGRRRYTEEQYFVAAGELVCENLRECAVLENFISNN